MSNKVSFLLFALVMLAVGAIKSFFIVPQTQFAIRIRLGDPIETYREPGLKFKVPFLDQVKYLEKRTLKGTVDKEKFPIGDQKFLIVDAYSLFRISDPLLFYKALANERIAADRLARVTLGGLRAALGRVPLSTLLSPEREGILKSLVEDVRNEGKKFGIDIVDVRITHADLPPENAESIYRRMQSDRIVEAKQLRAEGAEEATIIRSAAEKKRVTILAEAEKQAQILRGEADAEAARIYASAFSKDRDLYQYIRSLEAYKNAIEKTNTTLLLSTENKFFSVLNKE